ncbi:MAG: HAMP domain-containing sensor histidine kinase [Ilumatobacter sp.]|uniref:sensor histidine kinase n=1 Tax=Ilumatobacter sp. TaxID=1967498 RepID=UPI002614D94E|nr:HAMP domain-containing sensor histidine kinase [Ilumatobacter sp.]MDJ0767555.1 HAMP domain-containing sensor histidine kinase [Ilumatobacter sp.]
MTLRSRVVAGFALVLAAFIAAGTVVVVVQRDQLIEQLDRRLEAIIPLNPAPRPNDGEPRPLPPEPADPERPISDLFVAAVSGEGEVDAIVVGQLLDSPPDLASVGDVSARTFEFADSTNGSTRFRVLVEPNALGDLLVIALPSTDVDDTVQGLIVTFVLGAAVIAAVLGLLAWWVDRLGVRPISAMTDIAGALAAGDRGQRAPELDRRTEAGRLAEAFNDMLDQRDEAEDRLRQFVSDASHELRTPLTSIRGYLDLYEQGAFREQDQLDDVVRRMSSESNRMTGLVDSLLHLARLDEQQPLAREPVDVAALLTDVVADAHAAHPDRAIEVEPPGSGAALVAALDRNRTQQLLAGLVDNALTHAPDATVRLRATGSSTEIVVVVADDGPGLADEQAAHVFERFYRGDKARSRTTGGSGLGLAIARSIAAAHGGTIELTTAPGEGCEFAVRLPRAEL